VNHHQIKDGVSWVNGGRSTYVVIWVEHTRDVFGQVSVTDGLNVFTAVDYKQTNKQTSYTIQYNQLDGLV